MATPVFNTKPGQTIDREQLIVYINVDEYESPDWAPLGRRVENSSMEIDWDKNTIKDVLGNTYTTMKKATITQGFDDLPLDAGDKASTYIWGLAIYEQNAQALANQDVLVVHQYISVNNEVVGSFAERYDSSAVSVTGLGGDGGGPLTMPIEVDFGGARTLGSAKKDEDGKMQFTPESEDD